MVELELAGVWVEPDDRGRVEIGAWPRPTLMPVRARPIIKRRRVSGAPPHRIGLRIEGADHPTAAAAGAPRIAAPRRPGLIGAGDRKELPLLLPRFAVDAKDRSAPRPFAALAADNHHVLDDQRRAREADGELFGIDKPRVPHRFAGLHVDSDETPIDGAYIDIAISERDPAIVRRMRLLGDEFLIELGRIGP